MNETHLVAPTGSVRWWTAFAFTSRGRRSDRSHCRLRRSRGGFAEAFLSHLILRSGVRGPLAPQPSAPEANFSPHVKFAFADFVTSTDIEYPLAHAELAAKHLKNRMSKAAPSEDLTLLAITDFVDRATRQSATYGPSYARFRGSRIGQDPRAKPTLRKKTKEMGARLMRWNPTVAALITALALLLAASSASAIPDTYQVRLFNTDDQMTAQITNSSFTNQLVASSTFAVDNVTVDITAFVRPGSNVLNFLLTNTGGGWTWGDEVTKNVSTVLHHDSCGTKGSVGCENSDLTLFTNRLVDSFRFDVAAVPEPATLLLLGSGFVALMGVSRSRRHAH